MQALTLKPQQHPCTANNGAPLFQVIIPNTEGEAADMGQWWNRTPGHLHGSCWLYTIFLSAPSRQLRTAFEFNQKRELNALVNEKGVSRARDCLMLGVQSQSRQYRESPSQTNSLRIGICKKHKSKHLCFKTSKNITKACFWMQRQ